MGVVLVGQAVAGRPFISATDAEIVDAAGFGGLSQGSDSWGITFGLTYAFKALPWLAK